MWGEPINFSMLSRTALKLKTDSNVQTSKKSGTREPSSWTFLEKNPDIFRNQRFLDYLSEVGF